jgi:peptide subunit release factor RF-3
MPWKILRWVDSPLINADLAKGLPQGGTLAIDDQGRRVLLFTTDWYLRYYADNNPAIKLYDSPPQTV